MCSVSLRTVDFLGHQWFQEFCLQNRITEDVKTSLMETHFTCLKQLKKLYFQSLQNSSLTLVTHDQTDDQMPLKLSRTAQRFGADILDVKCNFSPSPKSIPSTAPLLMVEQLVPPERNSNLHRLPPPAINFDFASAISSTILMLNSADSYPNRLPDHENPITELMTISNTKDRSNSDHTASTSLISFANESPSSYSISQVITIADKNETKPMLNVQKCVSTNIDEAQMQKEVNVEVEVAMEMEEFNKRVGHILTNPTISLTKRNKFFLEIVRDFREKLPDQKLRCKICNFVSKRADHLKTHLARHANLKLYACGTCEKVFMRQDEKTRHEKKYCPGRCRLKNG